MKNVNGTAVILQSTVGIKDEKQALDYASDYQLKSACKDAICIAPSKVTQMIFAVFED